MADFSAGHDLDVIPKLWRYLAMSITPTKMQVFSIVAAVVVARKLGWIVFRFAVLVVIANSGGKQCLVVRAVRSGGEIT